MSEPKFTPGPWHIGTPPPNGEQTIGTVAGLMVAVATTGQNMAEETKANAHLIAAAPDLYKALAHLEPYLDAIVCYASTIEEHPPNGFILETKAALAKARGER